MLEFVAECVQCDHQRSVGDEAALAAVAVLADQVVELAVSVLVVGLLGFDCAGVNVGHVIRYYSIVYNRCIDAIISENSEKVMIGGLASAVNEFTGSIS